MTTIEPSDLMTETAIKLRALEVAELANLRDDIRALSNVLNLLLTAVSPEDARFLDRARELEAQVGKSEIGNVCEKREQ